VDRVELKVADGEVHIHLVHESDVQWSCPACGQPCPLYDHQPERRWRHLDTCQYQTILHAEPPRSNCAEHGARAVKLPWAEPSSRFTALFERLAIDWLKAASQKAVGDQLGLSWDEVHAIQERAVQRGLTRRQAEPIERLGVDEKSFTKGHHYFTIVNDLDRSRVLFVAEHRTEESLDGFRRSVSEEQRAAVRGVAMDMWDPYLNSTRKHLPDADRKIVFDKFHIAKHLGEAVDLVRRRENKQLKAAGDDRLTGTRYDWLRHPARMEPDDRKQFAALRDSSLKTARAWALKEAMMAFFFYHYERQTLSLVTQLAGPLPPETHDRKSPHDPAPLRQHHYLSAAPNNQCRQRVHQLQNPVGQVHRAWFPQQKELRHRHLLPLRRPRSHAFNPLRTLNAQIKRPKFS